MRMSRCVLFLALVLLGAMPLAAVAAQGRVLRGSVVDSSSGAPVPGANVTIRGTTLGTSSGNNGQFTLANVPAGELNVVVRRIGYRARQLVVPASAEEIRVAMLSDPLQLDVVVVSGQATAVEKRNVANSVATVSAEEIARVSSQSVEHALQGKVPGAMIQTNSGAPGGGVQVRMRGVTSINAVSDPLYVVDGVIVSNVAIPSNQNAVTNAAGGSNPSLTQDAQVNRVADLNPSDIESVEILKGASASAIYGSRASNGVIIITTKRGRSGRPEPRITQRLGWSQLSNKLGARRFTSMAEAVSVWGAAANTYFQPGVVYDHEKELAGRKPLSTETLVDISGGGERTRYYLSGAWKEDGGIIDNTGFTRQSLRANITQELGSRVSLDAGSNIIRTDARRGLTNNDNASVSFYMVLPFTPSFVNLEQRANGTFPDNPFVTSNPLQTASLMKNDEIVWRYIGSGRLTLNALSSGTQSLRFVGSGGVDYFTQKNDLLFPPELQFEPDDGQPGTSLLSNSDNINLNLGASGIHTFTPSGVLGGLAATTSFGVNHALRDLNISRVESRNLVGGLEIVNAGTNVQVRELRQRVVDFGMFAQEELLLLNERLLLSAGINADRSSVNSDDHEFFVYPKVSGSFRFANLTGFLDELKLRAAYGVSGNQPLYGQKFTPLTATQNLNGLPGLVVEGTVASNNLRPERQRELEGGFDASAYDNRATFEFSLFRRNVTELLLQRTLPQSSGFTTEIFNGGAMRTTGVEVALGIVPIQTRSTTWLFRSTFASNRSKITQLPVPTFRAGGFGTALGAFQIEEGASPTQIVGNDSLPDGSTIVRKIKDANPDFLMSFASELTYRRFHLSGLLDWQKGSAIVNLTKFLYDLGQNTADFATPITVGGTQTTKGAYRLAIFPKQTAVYVENGSFAKLRELTVGYDLPERLLGRIWGGTRSARVTFSGRNLLTITDYTGLDPEVSNFGNQNIARNIDVAPFPPSRSFWFGLEIGY